MGRDGYTAQRASVLEKNIFGLDNFTGRVRTGKHAAGHGGQQDRAVTRRRQATRLARVSRRQNRRPR